MTCEEYCYIQNALESVSGSRWHVTVYGESESMNPMYVRDPFDGYTFVACSVVGRMDERIEVKDKDLRHGLNTIINKMRESEFKLWNEAFPARYQ